MSIKIVEDFLSLDEVKKLKHYYSLKNFTTEKYKDTADGYLLFARHKDTDFNKKNSLIHKILEKKCKEVFQCEKMLDGAFYESYYPNTVHIDSHEELHKLDDKENHSINKAILIPLDENPLFKTVFFNAFYKNFDLPKQKYHYEKNYNHDLEFSHMTKETLDFVNSLEIAEVFEWKLGSAVSFPRNQLHCAINFAKYNLVKTYITLFF